MCSHIAVSQMDVKNAINFFLITGSCSCEEVIQVFQGANWNFMLRWTFSDVITNLRQFFSTFYSPLYVDFQLNFRRQMRLNDTNFACLIPSNRDKLKVATCFSKRLKFHLPLIWRRFHVLIEFALMLKFSKLLENVCFMKLLHGESNNLRST